MLAPLHVAKKVSVAACLIAYGAGPTLTSADGETAAARHKRLSHTGPRPLLSAKISKFLSTALTPCKFACGALVPRRARRKRADGSIPCVCRPRWLLAAKNLFGRTGFRQYPKLRPCPVYELVLCVLHVLNGHGRSASRLQLPCTNLRLHLLSFLLLYPSIIEPAMTHWQEYASQATLLYCSTRQHLAQCRLCSKAWSQHMPMHVG